MRHGGRALSTLRGAPVPSSPRSSRVLRRRSLTSTSWDHARTDRCVARAPERQRSPAAVRVWRRAKGRDAEDDVAMLGVLLAELLGSDTSRSRSPIAAGDDEDGGMGGSVARFCCSPIRRRLTNRADGRLRGGLPRRLPRPCRRRSRSAVSVFVPTGEAAIRSTDLRLLILRRIERPRRLLAMALAVAGVALAVAFTRLHSAADHPVTPSGVAAPDDLRIAEPAVGSVVVANGKRYRVGQDGDRLLIGDWACDGEATPAAFRPSTHEVFVFDRWAIDRPLAIEPTATVPDAVSDGQCHWPGRLPDPLVANGQRSPCACLVGGGPMNRTARLSATCVVALLAGLRCTPPARGLLPLHPRGLGRCSRSGTHSAVSAPRSSVMVRLASSGRQRLAVRRQWSTGHGHIGEHASSCVVG